MKTYKTTVSQYGLKKIKDADVPKAKISSSTDAAEYARQFYFEDIEIYESMFLILLNRPNITTGWVKISQGGQAGTMCDPKIVAKYAIESMAASVILVHNHPTGNTKPSDADQRITTQIKNGLQLLDVTLLDHVILTKESHYSFGDERLV
jgi:DNA repair protein RadC